MKRKQHDKITINMPNGEIIDVVVHDTKNGSTTLIFIAKEDVKISVTKRGAM